MGIAMLMLWGFAVDPPLWLVACLLLGLAVIRALPYGLGWLSRHLDLGLLLGLVLAILFGAIGSDYGLSDLFWGVSWWNQFIAGVSITALTLFLLFLGHLCDFEVEDQGARWLEWLERRSQPGRFGRWLAGAGLALLGSIWRPRGQSLAARLMVLLATLFFPLGLALVLVVLLHSSLLSASEGDGHRWGEWGLPLGAWVTFAVVMLVLGLLARAKIPARWRWWHAWLVIVVVMVAALAVALSGKREYITAATCLCLLPTLPAIFLFATYRRSLLRVVVAAVLILVPCLTNSDDTKLSLNGLEYLYDRDRMLDLKVHPSLEINPETQRLLLDLADLDMRDGKYDSAIKGLNKLIDTPEKKIKDGEKGETLGLPFQQARALFMRARAHEMVHQEQQALDDFNAMIKLHSAPAARSDQGEPTEADDLAMLIAKARLELVSLKRLSSARDDDSNKDLDEAEKELKRIKGASEQAGDKERAADASLELGLAHFLLKKYDEGIEDYKCCLEYYNAIKPADKKWQEAAAAYSGLGDVLLSQKNREDAIKALEHACDLAPDNALYGYKLGDALVRAKKLPEAVEVFERATRNDPERSDTFNELGKVQWSLRLYDKATESFRQAVKLEPKSAIYNYHLGVMLETTGWPAEAIEYYR
ncbi:MAG: tetratricopeptide repeat protein, partial [Isosphaeraceae bacterium]